MFASRRLPRVHRAALALVTCAVVASTAVQAEPDPRHPRVITSTTTTGNTFGTSVVAMDLAGFFGGEPVVAIAEPYRPIDPSSPATRGEVTLYEVAGTGMQVHSLITSPEPGSGFGVALAVGDLDDDLTSDLVIGAPNLGGGGGGAYLWVHDDDGASTLTLIYQETEDEFASCGRSLAIGDFNDDGDDDVAIGCPDGDVGADPNAGFVKVGYGDGDGGFSFETLSQDSAHIAGGAETGDRFGFSLAAGRFDDGTVDDLAIGVPSEVVRTSSARARSTCCSAALAD